jgi:hypothetical protein
MNETTKTDCRQLIRLYIYMTPLIRIIAGKQLILQMLPAPYICGTIAKCE